MNKDHFIIYIATTRHTEMSWMNLPHLHTFADIDEAAQSSKKFLLVMFPGML
jgi:hypothetical protein